MVARLESLNEDTGLIIGSLKWRVDSIGHESVVLALRAFFVFEFVTFSGING